MGTQDNGSYKAEELLIALNILLESILHLCVGSRVKIEQSIRAFVSGNSTIQTVSFMKILIPSHASSLDKFLTNIKHNRYISICDSACDDRILDRLNLHGDEKRPFTDPEIEKILIRYNYFRPFFEKEGLWPSGFKNHLALSEE